MKLAKNPATAPSEAAHVASFPPPKKNTYHLQFLFQINVINEFTESSFTSIVIFPVGNGLSSDVRKIVLGLLEPVLYREFDKFKIR